MFQLTLYPLQLQTAAFTFNVPQLKDVNGPKHGNNLLVLPPVLGLGVFKGHNGWAEAAEYGWFGGGCQSFCLYFHSQWDPSLVYHSQKVPQ